MEIVPEHTRNGGGGAHHPRNGGEWRRWYSRVLLIEFYSEAPVRGQ